MCCYPHAIGCQKAQIKKSQFPLWEVEFAHKKECTDDITRHKRV